MLKASKLFGVLIAACSLVPISLAQCPGYTPPHNVNLACAIATSSPSQDLSPAVSTAVGATMATQLSQLPIATAASGAGLVFDPSIGGFRVSEDIGPILTQRGDTIGKHKALVSLTYQRFAFDDIDGIDLKHLNVVNRAGNLYAYNDMRVDFRVDQFVALATFGLTDRVDVSFLLPFSFITLKSQRRPGDAINKTGSLAYSDFGVVSQPSALGSKYFPGSASGIGDVMGGIKATVFKSSDEKTSIAIGGQMRFPTGDVYNYLGSGAYGVKPYVVISHKTSRITPNFMLAYQWNSASPLNNDQDLPGSLAYSGGADIKIVKRLSVSGEFIGQYVINGPRLAKEQIAITGYTLNSTKQFSSSYSMNNASVGFKANPFRGLFVSASVLLKLDDAGLRAKAVPLVGFAYRF